MKGYPRKSLTTRVVVIDDHKMLNEALTTVVNSIPDCEVAGCACDEQEAIAVCQHERPDLILLDLVLDSASGLEVWEKIKPLCPDTRVLVFSGNLDSCSIQQALAAGAIGIIGKSASLSEFRTALRSAIAGRTYFCSEASDAIKQLVTNPDRKRHSRVSLSPRQQTVLQFVAQGFNSRQIANELGISVNTVINHRNLLMKKTGLHRVAQLSLFAADRGLISAITRHA